MYLCPTANLRVASLYSSPKWAVLNHFVRKLSVCKKITNYGTYPAIVLHIECPKAEIMARTRPCIKQVFYMQIS